MDALFERAVLVRPAGGPLLVWEAGPSARWSLVTRPDHVPLPDTACKETALDVAFSRQVGSATERLERRSLNVLGPLRDSDTDATTLRIGHEVLAARQTVVIIGQFLI